MSVANAISLQRIRLQGAENVRFHSVASTAGGVVTLAVGTAGAIYRGCKGEAFTRIPSGTRRTLYGIQVHSDLDVTITGWRGLRLVSHDAGTSWSMAPPSPFGGAERLLKDVAVAGSSRWAVGALKGTVLRSRDSGRTWVVFSTGFSCRFNGISFENEMLGYISADGGILLVTRDGGNSWEEQQTEPVDWLGIDCLEAGIAVAVGTRGAAIGTRDGGFSWHHIRFAGTDDLHCVHLLGDFFGFAAGEQGTLLKFGGPKGP